MIQRVFVTLSGRFYYEYRFHQKTEITAVTTELVLTLPAENFNNFLKRHSQKTRQPPFESYKSQLLNGDAFVF